MHNADLCDTLGNLVNRATNLCQKFCGGLVPDVPPPSNPPVDLGPLIDSYVAKMDQFDLQGGANVAIQGFRDVNRYLQDEAPWLKKGDEHEEFRKMVVRATLEAIYALTHLLMPFLPIGCKNIYEKVGKEPVALKELGRECRNLVAGIKVNVGKVLYEKSLSDEEIQGQKVAKKETYEEAQRRKKEQKEKAIAAGKKGQESGDPNQPEFTKIDIRVGKIIKVWNHEGADKLFCEQIELAEETGPREIASGLREHYSLEEMQDRLVLVVCNLKSSKIVGFASNGMVLAAKGEDGKVELITPPDGSVVGERVFIEGLSGDPLTAAQVKKKKTWEAVAKDLKTDEGGVATWQGMAIHTSAGPCKAASLGGAPIS
jgi:methionine--tRNA ligase beta chain